MWWDRSISAAEVRHASCSSHQSVNSALIGNGYATQHPLCSRANGPPVGKRGLVQAYVARRVGSIRLRLWLFLLP